MPVGGSRGALCEGGRLCDRCHAAPGWAAGWTGFTVGSVRTAVLTRGEFPPERVLRQWETLRVRSQSQDDPSGEAASQQPEAQGAAVTVGDGRGHELCTQPSRMGSGQGSGSSRKDEAEGGGPIGTHPESELGQ